MLPTNEVASKLQREPNHAEYFELLRTTRRMQAAALASRTPFCPLEILWRYHEIPMGLLASVAGHGETTLLPDLSPGLV